MKLLVIFASCLVQLTLGSSWSYDDTSASAWGYNCGGNSQSPINIDSSDADNLGSGCTLKFSSEWYNSNSFTVKNNGHAVQLDFHSSSYETKNCKWGWYRAPQLHFHWGCSNNRGSEHELDGTRYPLEMHIVHTNSDGSSLAVLGFFFEVGSYNSDLAPIISALSSVHHPGDENTLNNFNVYNLIADAVSGPDYYQYDGSLTTPPCSEIVNWNVMKKTIKLSAYQLSKFRTLKWHDHDDNLVTMCDNFRPLQAVNGRDMEEAETED